MVAQTLSFRLLCKRIAAILKERGDNGEEKIDANSEENQERKKKLKRRFDVIVIAMAALNVISLIVIAGFFSWYRDYTRRDMQSYVSAQAQGMMTSGEDVPAKKKSSEEEPGRRKSAEDAPTRKGGTASSAEPLPGAPPYREGPRPPGPAGPPRKPLAGIDPYFW